MHLRAIVLATSATFFLVACKSNEVKQELVDPIAQTEINSTSKDETLTWDQHQRSGAAYSQAAYHHVLGLRNTRSLSDSPPAVSISATPSEVIKRVTRLQSYSVYELERWERFCGHGMMDSKDWEFISIEGRDNIPENLKTQCSPPSFTRQDYLASWKSKCRGADLSVQDQHILRTTLQPGNICDE